MKHLFAAGAVALSFVAIACGDDDTDSSEPAALGTADSGATVDSGDRKTTVDAGDASPIEDAGTDADATTEVETAAQRCTTTVANPTASGFVELCTPEKGTVQHVTLVGVQATTGHAYTAIEVGFDTAPASAQAPLAAGQVRVLLYGRGPPPPALVQVDFGATSETLGTTAAFVNLVSTVCFDISDGSETVAPRLTLWVDGQNGAICADRTTLRATTAFDATTTWPAGIVSKNKKLWFGASAGLPGPTIIVSSVAAL